MTKDDVDAKLKEVKKAFEEAVKKGTLGYLTTDIPKWITDAGKELDTLITEEYEEVIVYTIAQTGETTVGVELKPDYSKIPKPEHANVYINGEQIK